MAGDLTPNTAVPPTLAEGLPTEYDLPYSDGIPMESYRHVLQFTQLILTLSNHWAGRQDFFVGGDMFLHFDLERIQDQGLRGPDVFLVRGVQRRERKSWVVWQEGKGPDLVIELLSESTAQLDRGEKKRIYERVLKAPEYILFDPDTGELEGFELQEAGYVTIAPDEQGLLPSKVLGLRLGRWTGEYEGAEATWLRWYTEEGELVPTIQEHARTTGQQRDAAERKAAQLAARLRELGLDPEG